MCAQIGVVLEHRHQEVEAARHVEVHGRRYLAQVLRGEFRQAGRRLAVVDVQRAAVAQHQVEAEVAAEGMVPGQPVDDGLHLVLEERPDLRQHLLVGAEHAVRVDHALGRARGARGEENFRHRVRREARERQLQRRAGIGLEEPRHWRRDGAYRGERGRELLRLGGEHQAGFEELEDVLEFREILRHQRIGRGNGRHWYSHVHRAEREQRVVHAVVGKDRDRPVRGEAQVEQGLADAAGVGERIAVADAPPAVALALGNERSVRRALVPVHQPVAYGARMFAELLRRTQHDRAIGALVNFDFGRRVAQPRMQTHRFSSPFIIL
jgi:hypothetical protein